MSFWTLNRRVGGLLVALALCVLLPGCGESKITKANADKINNGMTEKEVTAILGPPSKSVEAGGDIGGLGAAAGIDMGGALAKLPKGKTAMWEDGKKVITIMFVDGKVASKIVAF